MGITAKLFRVLDEILDRVTAIENLLILQESPMDHAALDAAIADLTAKVSAHDTVDGGAIALLAGLKSQLDAALAAGDDSARVAAVQALAAKMEADSAAMAAAVKANTPAAAPAPDPPPTPAS